MKVSLIPNIIFKFLLIIILIGFNYKAISQENSDPHYLSENLPKSPEVSSLGEYGQVENNLYTGKANLTVPLHSISWEGLSIPINLSYDTGGIQVTSDAGWVGLGWQLSPYAGISRTIYGMDDLRMNNAIATVTGEDGPINGPIGFAFNENYVSYPEGGTASLDIEELE